MTTKSFEGNHFGINHAETEFTGLSHTDVRPTGSDRPNQASRMANRRAERTVEVRPSNP